MVYDDTVGEKVKTIPLINKQSFLLVCLALCMNILFLYLYNPKVYFAITEAHGQIGYNFFHYNVIGMDRVLTQKMNGLMCEHGCLVDYDRVEAAYIDSYEPFPINDTVAYGLLLGLIWKITGSLKFYDMQILQVIIFALLMVIYYQVAYMLFGCTQIALCCGITQLLFFPLLAYNVMPVRDVWAYYGLLILCYAVLSYINKQITIGGLVGCLIFFALCQWIRPTLSFALMVMTIFLVAYAVKKDNVRALHLIGYMWFISLLLFWLPFSYYNYTTYDRYMVSPAGQSLLEGLGELPNRWGHQLNDEYVNEFISNKYNLVYGTVAFDEAAMHEFKQCVHEDPIHYIKTLLWRLPDILFPGLQWIFYEQSPYVGCNGVIEKLIVVFSSWKNIFDFMLRHIWMRFYLLSAYAGLMVMLMRKRYFAAAFMVSCLVSGLSTYPSHIEYRYIVPFYWVMSFFAGSLLYDIMNCIFNKCYCKRLFMKKYSMLLLLMICAIQCNAMDEVFSKEIRRSARVVRAWQEHSDRVKQEKIEAAGGGVILVIGLSIAYKMLPDEGKQRVREAFGSLLQPLNEKRSMNAESDIEAQWPVRGELSVRTLNALLKATSREEIRAALFSKRVGGKVIQETGETSDDIRKRYRIVVKEKYDCIKRNIECSEDHN